MKTHVGASSGSSACRDRVQAVILAYEAGHRPPAARGRRADTTGPDSPAQRLPSRPSPLHTFGGAFNPVIRHRAGSRRRSPQASPSPAWPRPGPPAPRRRRPAQANLGKKPTFVSRCCTTTTASPSSPRAALAGYGGAARFETVVERLRAEAAVAARRPREPRQAEGHGHAARLLRRQLPGRARAAARLPGGPAVARRRRRQRARLRRDDDRQPRVRLRAGPPGRVHRGRRRRHPVHHREPRLRGHAARGPRRRGPIAPAAVVERDGERIGIIGLTTPDVSSISSPGNVRSTRPRAGRQRPGRRPRRPAASTRSSSPPTSRASPPTRR